MMEKPNIHHCSQVHQDRKHTKHHSLITLHIQLVKSNRGVTAPEFLFFRNPPMQNRPDFRILKKLKFKYFPNQIDLQTGSNLP